MFNSHLLVVTVVAAAHFCLVSSFQPGSDYDVYKTNNLYNCTGHTPVSNVTALNAADTLPQIEPSACGGWEQWSLFLHGTFPILLRWSQGDPTSPARHPARFDILVSNVNGATVQRTVIGNFSYANNKHFKRIAIGENSLTWDSDALWYNVSVSVDDYRLQLDSFSATLDAFHPNVAFHNGLLEQSGDLFGSVPLLRGQATGRFYTPTKQAIPLDGLSVMRHVFSENPLASYVKRCTAGTIWGYSMAFYDTHVFYQTETTGGSVHEAAFLGRALPTPGQKSGFSSTWATYAVTDDSNLYHLSVDAATKGVNVSFSGCSSTNDVPYVFNISASAFLGEFTDFGGGKTSYYDISDGTTSASFEGAVRKGTLAGILEEYQTPPS